MNLLYVLVYLGILGALATAFIVILIIGVRRKSRLFTWLGLIPGYFVLVIAEITLVLFAIQFLAGYSDTTNARKIRESFVDNFNFQPGPDFVPMKQRVVGGVEGGCRYLQFKVSPATFQRISTNKFDRMNDSEFLDRTVGPDAPSWWPPTNYFPKPVLNAGWPYYKNENWSGPFHANRAYMYYDSVSNIVYLCNQGND